MAANMKEVKLRIKSVKGTMQITKAMELVASSKLRKAKGRAEASRPYFRELHNTLKDIAQGNHDFSSDYVKISENPKCCYVVIAGDRGLAGGYNTNLMKCFEEKSAGKEFVVLPIGKKTAEYCNRKGITVLTEEFAEIADVDIADCYEMADLICREYRNGRFGHIELCFTTFVSMLTQQPEVLSVLPIQDLAEQDSKESQISNVILYEPDAAAVFDTIVPGYVSGVIYGAVCESLASELAARRMAMESATNNAEEMLEQLNLYYNRARQAGITQEITEIVSGAEGI